uniref:C-X-C motif chemokine n=1 Tax=Saimiri boliviensis boliviensis TaxID=39432 RepID=A0A2K6STF7_SAIBB
MSLLDPAPPQLRSGNQCPPLANELRCQCLQTLQGIHLKNIQSVEVKRPGPHCDRTEVIATLRNGQKACLNPASPMAKKIIEKMLNSDKPN